MLSYPPSRINLTAADLASFDRRWTARQAARKDAENVRIGHGPGRQTRHAFIAASANIGRQRAESCSSQATICILEDDSTHHSNPASPAQELELPALATRRSSPISTGVQRSALSPRLHSVEPSVPRCSPSRPAHQPTFPIYEDTPTFQAFVKAQPLQRHRAAAPALERVDSARDPAALNAIQLPVIDEPRVYQTLDPGAPVFVPRIRFGSTGSTSEDYTDGTRSHSLLSPVERAYGRSNLRVRSSFERNTQNSSRGNNAPNVIPHSSLPFHGLDGPSNRRRSRNNDQIAARQRPNVGLHIYPAIRPPSVAFSSRRSSGSQRPVIFPHRRSSRQHLIEFERPTAAQGTRRQDRQTLLSVPRAESRCPTSPSISTSSRSTPNLLHPATESSARYRSTSLSSSRVECRLNEPTTAQKPRPNATALSESSGLVREILSQRDSPLDRLMQKYGQESGRPRSVGRSFDRLPRKSLLSGDPFRDHPGHGPRHSNQSEKLSSRASESRAPDYTMCISPVATKPVTGVQVDLIRSPNIRTPHKREVTIEDPVALALALPSPEVPSSVSSLRSLPQHSSPVTRSSSLAPSSPPLPSTPMLRSGPSSPLLSSQSLAAAITPRVPVYNDNRPVSHQPQTPADIPRTRRARERANTALGNQAAVPLSTDIASPERHHHRHTFPSTTAPEVTVGTTPVRTTTTVETATTLTSAAVRLEGHSSSENEIGDNLYGLEQDRRVWIRRHEDGSLDITPPREGRFEKYLS